MYKSSFIGILRNLPQNFTPNIICESASTEVPYIFDYTANYTDNNCWDITLNVRQDTTNAINTSTPIWGPFTFIITATNYAPAILTSSTYEGVFDIKMEQYVTRILNEKTNTGYVIKDTEARNNITTLDSNAVHKTGNETISGTKTFTDSIASHSGVDETSSSAQEKDFIKLYDNQTNTGFIRQYWSTTQNQLRIRNLARHGEAAGAWGDIQQIIDANGNYRVNIDCAGTLTNMALTSATGSSTATDVPTKGWVNNPATSTNVVHRTGNETIGGQKTFTAQVTKTNSSTGADTIFVNKNTAITKGTAPSTNVESRWRLTDSSSGDSNSALIAGVDFQYDTSNRTSAFLQVGKPEAGSTSTARMGIFYPATGNPYTEAPTPATSDNSTKIATTAFVNSHIQQVSALPASPLSNVLYVIPEE